jgi:hypothetical protein
MEGEMTLIVRVWLKRLFWLAVIVAILWAVMR